MQPARFRPDTDVDATQCLHGKGILRRRQNVCRWQFIRTPLHLLALAATRLAFLLDFPLSLTPLVVFNLHPTELCLSIPLNLSKPKREFSNGSAKSLRSAAPTS